MAANIRVRGYFLQYTLPGQKQVCTFKLWLTSIIYSTIQLCLILQKWKNGNNMKQFSLILCLLTLASAVWSQARIPVNEPATGNNKPAVNNTTTTANNTTDSSELTKYADPNGRFTIGYPGNWILNSSPESAIIKITSPLEKDDDNFRQSVNLQIEAYNSSIDDYVNASLNELKRLMKGFREVSSMYFNRNGSRAYQIVYKGKYGDNEAEWQVKQLYVVANSKAYILTYVSRADERDAFETAANKIFNSFKY